MGNAENIQKNLTKSLNAIKKAAENGADLILYQEAHLTDFFRYKKLEKRKLSSYLA